MGCKVYTFDYQCLDKLTDLPADEQALFATAKEKINLSYSPYSSFKVVSAARLRTGEIICGTNQENASYPAGICAERVMLAAKASLFPHTHIETIAITYQHKNKISQTPISPCGICRQSLLEVEIKQQQPIKIMMAGFTGAVFIIPSVVTLLPLAFTDNSFS